MIRIHWPLRALFAAMFVSLATVSTFADDKEKEDGKSTVKVGEGRLELTAPEKWERKQPRVRITEAEFSVAPAEGDEAEGRVTIMGAGGTVKANVDRWIGQFTQTNRNKTEVKKISGQEVHIVDLAGTFKDQRGPFAPATLKEKYRMLGAIIVTEKSGQYFVKFYGPENTVTANEKAFHEMIGSLKVK